mmetsp:Transcript_1612/g.6359  ORF Transcript_1612/g.6359 Transcript_1612/m.6359 type:complete len:247 (+) Transcript_1612:1979-2719(+)
MKMASLHLGSSAPLAHHLRPLSTSWSVAASCAQTACMLVASLDATAGSVMAKHERILPSSSGLSQRSCCSCVPYRARVSMLPVSGALQLKTSGANGHAPMASDSGAYSRFVRPGPQSTASRMPGAMRSRVSLGMKRFHSPAARAFAFSSSMSGNGRQRASPTRAASSAMNSFSAGYTCSSMNAFTRASSAAERSLWYHLRGGTLSMSPRAYAAYALPARPTISALAALALPRFERACTPAQMAAMR